MQYKKSPTPTTPIRSNFTGMMDQLKGFDLRHWNRLSIRSVNNNIKVHIEIYGAHVYRPSRYQDCYKKDGGFGNQHAMKQEDIDEEIFKILVCKDLDTYVKTMHLYFKNNSTLYSVVLIQCMGVTENCLEGEGNFEEIDKESDVIKLIKIIKIIFYVYKSKS